MTALANDEESWDSFEVHLQQEGTFAEQRQHSQHSLESDDASEKSEEDGIHGAAVEQPDYSRFEQLTKIMSIEIGKMGVINPKVLRVTSAFQAFQQCAAALRSNSDTDFYHKSREKPKISTFWSHSWHGSRWNKILTLLMFYNGTPAVILGLLAGAVMMPLFSFGILPGFDRGWHYSTLLWSTWSLCSGVLVTCLVALFWRPRTEVFLDRICISQEADLKTQAIFSLAGMLSRSDTMLILWDPTWTERLWCLFELAAFLKSKQSQKKALVVRPTFLGPISIGVFLTVSACVMPVTTVPVHTELTVIVPIAAVLLVGLVVAYPAVSTLRNYFRDLDVMKQQLQSISFDTTRSACCDQDHVSPTGTQLLCDRKIVKECVKIWFGSQQAFEDTVRSEVLDILKHDLTDNVFSIAWTMSVTSPIMLAFVDLSMTFAQLSGWSFWDHPATALFLEGLVFWLLVIPAVKDPLILCCRIMRGKPTSRCLEAIKNAFTLALIACPLCMVLLCYGLTRFVFSANAMHRAGAFAGSMIFLSLGHCLLTIPLKACLRQPGW